MHWLTKQSWPPHNEEVKEMQEQEHSEERREAEPSLRDRVIDAIRTVYDPEIPVNIYELGLIYEVNVDGGKVEVLMTLTSPGCPAAGMLPSEVQEKVMEVEGVEDANVEITFDPPWDQSMMSDEARLELGFM